MREGSGTNELTVFFCFVVCFFMWGGVLALARARAGARWRSFFALVRVGARVVPAAFSCHHGVRRLLFVSIERWRAC